MQFNEDSAHVLFQVDELIPSGGKQAVLKILEISQKGIRIQSTRSQSSKLFTYQYIQVVVDGFERILPHSVHESIQPVLRDAGEKPNYWTENYAYGIARAFLERAGLHQSDSSAQVEETADGKLPATSQGFRDSATDRKLIEVHAVDLATRYFEEKGFEVEVHGKPFDLFCNRGKVNLYVEVKGTQSLGTEILLTRGEVKFNQANAPNMALFIVSEILVTATGKASGGKVQLKMPWTIEEDQLTPFAFTYRV